MGHESPAMRLEKWLTLALCRFSAPFKFKRLVVFYATITCVAMILAVYFTFFDVFQLSCMCERLYKCRCLKKSLVWALLHRWSCELYFLLLNQLNTFFYQQSKVKLCVSKSQKIPEVTRKVTTISDLWPQLKQCLR